MRVIGVVGWKNNGKTTLVVRLVEHLTARGYRISTVKHAHHEVELDKPGKDSWRHREAGAAEVVLATSRRWALIHELRGAAEPTLEDQLKQLSPCDLVIVEGFKHAPIPKLEVWRRVTGEPLIHPNDPHIVAIATDARIETPLPRLDLNDDATIASFILAHLRLQ